jgi:hypothetical protein
VYFFADDRVADYTDRVHVCSFERVVTSEPTCTETGTAILQCVCGKENGTEIIPSKGHNWDEWVVVRQPMINVPGLQFRGCFECSETEEKEIPAITQPPTTTPAIKPVETAPPTTSTPEMTLATEPPTEIIPQPTEPAEETTTPKQTVPPEISTAPQPPTDSTAPKTEDTTASVEPEQTTYAPKPTGNDFLNPELNDMLTAFVSPEGVVLSVPSFELEGYEGVTLSVEPLTEEYTEHMWLSIAETFGGIENHSAYDICMLAPDGSKVGPDDYVIISIPIPDNWESELVRVLFLDPEGDYFEETICSVSDDGQYARFVANHFSCYAIIQLAAPEEPAETVTPTQVPSESPANSNTVLGEPWAWVAIGLLAVTGVVIVVVTLKKKRK